MPFKRKTAPRISVNGTAPNFEALYEEYFHRVYAYVASRFENPHEAEDVVADVFLKVMQRLPQFRGENFSSWLFTIAHNTLRDTYRRQKGELVELEDEIVADMQSPEQLFLTRESAAEMLQHVRVAAKLASLVFRHVLSRCFNLDVLSFSISH